MSSDTSGSEAGGDESNESDDTSDSEEGLEIYDAVSGKGSPPGGPEPEPEVKTRSALARWSLRIGLVLGLVLLYFAATFVDVWYASRRVATEPAQAAVVLGAAQYDGEPSPVLEARLDRAAELYLDELVSLVVVTGGGQEGDRTTEAKAGYNYLRRAGVPDEQLRLEVDGTSTYESLAATSRFLRRENVDEVILVTSAYHARRVQLVAEELGLQASVSATGDASFDRLVQESVAVGIGRAISFRRLDWVRP